METASIESVTQALVVDAWMPAACRTSYSPLYVRVQGYVFALLEWMSGVLRSDSSNTEEHAQVSTLVETVKDSLTPLLLLGYESFTMEGH